MAHTRRTLQLDRKSWDITLDGIGRIVLVTGDYATAQNVANESRLFTEDAYFAQDKGIPHFLITLGHRVSASVVRSYLRDAALQVPDVKEVLSVEITSIDPQTRALVGDIKFTTVEGANNGEIRTYI